MKMAGEKISNFLNNVSNVFLDTFDWLNGDAAYIMHSSGLRNVPRSAQLKIPNVLF